MKLGRLRLFRPSREPVRDAIGEVLKEIYPPCADGDAAMERLIDMMRDIEAGGPGNDKTR